MKKAVISLLLCVVIVAVGTAVSRTGQAYRVKNSAAAQPQVPVVERLPNVSVQSVRTTRIEESVVLTGSIEAWEVVTISAETRGRIERQRVEEGDIVAQGDELIRVNTTTIEAQRAQAIAQLTLADQELERIQSLRAEGISSSQDFDRAVMERKAASATVLLAEIQLAQSVIKSQFDGIVDTLYLEEGEFVDVGGELVRLVQVHKVKAVVGVSERDIALLSEGATAAITLDAYPGETFDGRIFRIATTAEDATRSFKTEIEIDNAAGLIKPGMIARVTLVRRAFDDAVSVPLFAVIARDNERYVFVAEPGGVVRLRPVVVGMASRDTLHIVDGLSEGDQLVISGHRDLRDGEAVNIIVKSATVFGEGE